jgi:hypothetical protein
LVKGSAATAPAETNPAATGPAPISQVVTLAAPTNQVPTGLASIGVTATLHPIKFRLKSRDPF